MAAVIAHQEKTVPNQKKMTNKKKFSNLLLKMKNIFDIISKKQEVKLWKRF